MERGADDERRAPGAAAAAALLRGPRLECTIDANCPCGSHCDPVENACRFTCMVPH